MSDDPNKPEPAENDQPKPQDEPEAPTQVQGDADGNVTVPGPKPLSRGAQVRLTGEARDAARGGLSATMEGNTIAKQALEADGTVADGYSPDGSTSSGKPPADTVVTEQGEPIGEVPAAEGTRITVQPDKLEEEPSKPKE